MAYLKSTYENINENMASYNDLSRGEKTRISEFSLIWQMFEGKIFNYSATAPRIRNNFWIGNHSGQIVESIRGSSFAYFRSRYTTNNNSPVRLNALLGARGQNLRTNIVNGLDTAALNEDKVIACALICFRLRNNLFHGVKAAEGFADQSPNFKYAILFLNSCIDLIVPSPDWGNQ